MSKENDIYLYYTPILKIPFIGEIFYLLQLLNLKLNLFPKLYLGNLDRKLEKKLIFIVEHKFNKIYCSTFNAYPLFKYFTPPVILDLALDNKITVDKKNYESIVNTLVNIDIVTSQTVPLIKKLVPRIYKSFIVQDSIIS